MIFISGGRPINRDSLKHLPHCSHTHTHTHPQTATLLDPLKRVAVLTRGALRSSGQSSTKLSPVVAKKQSTIEVPKPSVEEASTTCKCTI